MSQQRLSKHFDPARFAFLTVSLATLIGTTMFLGLYMGAARTPFFEAVDGLRVHIVYSVRTFFGQFSTMTGTHPDNFLQPLRYAGDGVTVNERRSSDDLILLSGFFRDTNELRLIRRDGSIVRRWPVSFTKIFPDTSHLPNPPTTDWNVDTHGAMALPDGSVVFNFEYSGLVKLGPCGDVIWTVRRPTHHSVARAEGGGFWVPASRRVGADEASAFPPFDTPYLADVVLKVSDDGTVVDEISVPKLFYDSGLEALLTASGAWFSAVTDWDREIVHLNKVAELSTELARDFPMFRAGDLAISIREMNLVMVIDPKTRRIKWWQVGPWLRQHDPEFVRGGKIVVFNNNTYRTGFIGRSDKSPPSAPRVSNIVELDPTTRAHRVIYGGNDDQQLYSIIRGKVQPTPAGGLMITEFEGGRALETDRDGHVVWEYVNRYSDTEAAEISEAQLYPSSYFTVPDWSCPDRPGQP